VRVVFSDNVLIDHARPHGPFDLQPHLGLLSLLAVVIGEGHDGAVFDPSLALHRGELDLDGTLYERMASRLLDLEPDVVGFTALGCNLICTYKVACHLKRRRPRLPVLLGGPHATILHREVLEDFDVFDLVVRHEAEATLPAVLDAVGAGLPFEALQDIPGIAFKRDAAVVTTAPAPLLDDLDLLPWPAYDRYPIEELGLTSMRVEAGRGCPFSCTFCSTASFFGRRYRLKSAARLVAELDFLHDAYGLSDFALTHDMFTANRNKVSQFCEAVGDRGYTWSCSARMDCVDTELLEAMRAAGCQSMYFGVETGSRRMQKISDKHLDLDLVAPVLDATEALGMKAVVSMITGYPEETSEDQADTLDMLGACAARSADLVSLQLHLLTPEPGTVLFNQYADRLDYDGYVTDFNFPTLAVDDADVMREHPRLFMNHHYYETVLPRAEHVFADRAFQLVNRLGFPLIRWMLRDFDGRLSLLVRAVRTFVGEDRTATFDGADLVAFARQRWGEGHAVVSAVRLLVAADDLRLAALGDPAPRPSGGYRLAATATLLRDIDNVPDLLEAFVSHRSALAAGGGGGARRDVVLFVPPDDPNRLEAYEVDGPTTGLVEWLARARPSEEVSAWADGLGIPVAAVQSLLDDMCRTGVVVAPEEARL